MIGKTLLWIADTVFLLIFLGIPVFVYGSHWLRPEWFERAERPGKTSLLACLCWGVAVSLLSWAIVLLSMILDSIWGRGWDNGFSVFCAFALGWLYIWFVMIPVGVLYGIVCLSVYVWRRLRKRGPQEQTTTCETATDGQTE